MPFEIEMLSVGAADSIILRYFNNSDQDQSCKESNESC